MLCGTWHPVPELTLWKSWRMLCGFCGCGRGGEDRYTWRCAQRGASDREVQLGESSESLSFTEKGSATGLVRCPGAIFRRLYTPASQMPPLHKGRRMIHFFSMGKFVYYNIIQDFFRGEDQPPVEIKVSFAGAASPAGFLFPDSDTAVGYAHFSGVGCGFSFEYFSGGFHIITATEFRKRRVFSLGLCRFGAVCERCSRIQLSFVRENDGWWNLALCVERGQLPDRKR